MRVRLIIQDKEYCRALVETIGRADKDVFVEVSTLAEASTIGDGTLVITDIKSERPELMSLEDYTKRVIYLTTNPGDVLNLNKKDECQKLFKYSSISNIFSDVEQINYMWTGETGSTLGLVSRVYAVCSDMSDDSSRYSRALARQVLFRRGGSILLLSLKHVNEFGSADENNRSKFSRLMYYMDTGKDYPTEAFTYKDSYGISYMRLPRGLNPIAYMKSQELVNLTRNLTHNKFDTVILDIGSVFNEANILMVNKADNILWFANDSVGFRIEELFLSDSPAEKIKRFNVTAKDIDIELAIDDYVREVYGIKESADEQKKDN